MTETTARLHCPLLSPGQAHKEIFHNEAIARIDLAVSVSISGMSELPPVEPVPGECWIVADEPAGAWSGQAGMIAGWISSGWRFIEPVVGMLVWRRDLLRHERWTGETWDGAMATGGVSVGGQQVVGPRQAAIAAPSGGATIDAEARAAIDAIIAALMSHGLVD